ncbi:unnamed protein product [Heterosigma akashiwo]
MMRPFFFRTVLLALSLVWCYSFTQSTGKSLVGQEKLQRNVQPKLSATKETIDQNAFSLVRPTLGNTPELSLGAPRARPEDGTYVTAGGVEVTLTSRDLGPAEGQAAVDALVDALDARKGVLLSSSYEFPGRYARWTIGLVDPPLEVVGRGRRFEVTALNARGEVLLPAFREALAACEDVADLVCEEGKLEGRVKEPPPGVYFPEEERSKQPSLFTVVRRLTAVMAFEGDPQLGLYGALGYDLTFQFDPIELQLQRDPDQKDLALFLPDRVLVVDQVREGAWELDYDFAWAGRSTAGLPREGKAEAYEGKGEGGGRDTAPGDYARKVEAAREEFACGNLFECVLSQTFANPCPDPPSAVFRRLQRRNPAPYGLFLNLGGGEYLVGASPEMFDALRLRPETCGVETTPHLGARSAARRGAGGRPADQGPAGEPEGGERADHVHGRGPQRQEPHLRAGQRAGAGPPADRDVQPAHPHRGPRGGVPAPGVRRAGRLPLPHLGRHRHGRAQDLGHPVHRAAGGLPAPLVRRRRGPRRLRRAPEHGADAAHGAREGRRRRGARGGHAALRLRAGRRGAGDRAQGLGHDRRRGPPGRARGPRRRGGGGRAPRGGGGGLHRGPGEAGPAGGPLGNYLRQTGAEVVTLRAGPNAWAAIEQEEFDLAVLSPGPGSPDDFQLRATMGKLVGRGVPAFGVCLGLQGMVEYFGGELDQLSYPMHGKPSALSIDLEADAAGLKIFEGLPSEIEIARYHSLYGKDASMPACLQVPARTADGLPMAVQHRTLPYAAVQFHPESILTNPVHGMTMLDNALKHLAPRKREGGFEQ